MAEDKKSFDGENPYDELKGFFPEEYDLTPEELLKTPDFDSFDTSDMSAIWEDLESVAPPAAEDTEAGAEDIAVPTNEVGIKEETIIVEEKNKNRIGDTYDIIEMFVICTACIIIFFSFFARLTVVDGESMCDTLQDGEWLFISDFMYEAEQGDIVVIQDTSLDHPELKKPLIKRVIGLGGQTVDISASGVVTITNKDGTSYVLNETYTKDEPYFKSSGHFEVPDGYIFVMGDNRNGSTDSRDSRVGFIDERCIIGNAKLRLFPFDVFGSITNPLEKE